MRPEGDLLAEGLSCGLHRVERLMRVHGLKARPPRPGLPKDDGLRSIIAGNLLDRQFTAEAPNQKRIADFTYIWTAEGWLYVAVVIDLFSRRIVEGYYNRHRMHSALGYLTPEQAEQRMTG
jgi:putative transposase